MAIPFACTNQLEVSCRNRIACPICYEEGFSDETIGDFIHDHV